MLSDYVLLIFLFFSYFLVSLGYKRLFYIRGLSYDWSKVILQNLFFRFIFFSFLFFMFFYMYCLYHADSFLKIYLFLEIITFLNCFFVVFNNRKLNFIYKQKIKLLSWSIINSLIKYFFLSSIISGFFLLGIFGFYLMFGTMDLFLIGYFFTNGAFFYDAILILSSCFICFGFFFKLAAAPFHLWAPEVYEVCSINILVLFSVVSKLIYSFLICFFVTKIFWFYFEMLQPIFFLFGSLSIFVGSLVGLLQFKIKRIFAYSSILNIGYFLIGIAGGTLLHKVFAFLNLFSYLISILILLFILDIVNSASFFFF